MSSVIRGKIWEGRCEFGTEEQRTSGKKEYVVNSQLRAFSTQLFGEGKYRTISFTRANYSYCDTSLDSDMDKKKFQEQKKNGFLSRKLQLRENMREGSTNRN